ncbi:VOC family protein [Nocardioides sp. KR10-350]|uniref:VOC family protein n=1 Tax=Nocardioides cheoyonin TaxID=3156615 RepID=UPI0032B5E566
MATLNPYLSFQGEARQALEFYQSALGGTVTAMTFGDNPAGQSMGVPPEAADLVMHGQLDLEDGLVIMAADTPPGMEYVAPTSGITVAMTGGADEYDRLSSAFARLSEGGKPGMPLEKAPWGDYFGQFTDRFGIAWMFNIAGS